MNTILQDVRYGARTLRRNPGFTLVAVMTLALGVGANSAIFSVVYGVLLAPLPYPDAAHLVGVTGTYPTGAVVAMRDRLRTMDVAAYAGGQELNLTGIGTPIRVTGARVSPELFAVLQAAPELGRTFAPGEDTPGRDNGLVISHAAWERYFQRTADIIGRPVDLGGVSRQVVGVMPPAFRFPTSATEFWIPLRNDPRSVPTYWAGDFMPVIGRLRPPSSLNAARAEIRAFQPRVSSMFPWRMPADWNRDVSVVPLRTAVVAESRDRVLILAGAALAVLLVACANIANLTLSRAATRRTELMIRSAIGAGRRRIVRQLLTESVLLALVGGTAGWLLALYGVPMLKWALPADTPRLQDVQMDWRVAGFTAVLAVATGLVAGIAPSLHLSRPGEGGSLESGTRGAIGSVPRRLRSALVITEIAFAVLLVCAAGLLIRSFRSLSRVDPGFRPAGVMTARVTPNESFCADVDRCFAFYRRVLDDVSSSPGIAGAALVSTPPLAGKVAKRSLKLEGLTVSGTETEPLFWLNVVSGGYFGVMRIPLIAGTDFGSAAWSGHPPVAIVTAASARRFWSGQNPIGKRLRFVGESEWRTVVGVAADVRAYDLRRDLPDWMQGTVYVPYAPNATLEDGRVPAEMTLVVRANASGWGGERLRRIVAAANRDIPVADVKPLDDVLSDAVSTPASTAALVGAFAAVALILGTIGVYGVLSFLVSNRTREIAVRMALGAERREVLWLVVKDGMTVSAAGIAAGLAGALALSRWLSSQLYGISALDPVTYLLVGLLMLVVTLLACAVPARRALHVDPLVALR